MMLSCFNNQARSTIWHNPDLLAQMFTYLESSTLLIIALVNQLCNLLAAEKIGFIKINGGKALLNTLHSSEDIPLKLLNSLLLQIKTQPHWFQKQLLEKVIASINSETTPALDSLLTFESPAALPSEVIINIADDNIDKLLFNRIIHDIVFLYQNLHYVALPQSITLTEMFSKKRHVFPDRQSIANYLIKPKYYFITN